MKKIKNNSLQSWGLYLRTEEGTRVHWLPPGASVVVPDSYITDHVETLTTRKLLTTKSVQEINYAKYCQSRCLCY